MELHAGTKFSEEMWALVHDGKEAEFEEPKEPEGAKTGQTPPWGKAEWHKMKLKMWMNKQERAMQEGRGKDVLNCHGTVFELHEREGGEPTRV